MKHKYLLSPHAEAELAGAAEWYEHEEPGIGHEFLQRFRDDIAAICEAPGRWPIYRGRIRRYVMKRFPYVMFFEDRNGVAIIYRVAHGARDPGSIRRDLPAGPE